MDRAYRITGSVVSRPRIRSIKPEIWTDEAFGTLDPESQILFIGLISHADDHGRLKATASRVAALVWPFRRDLAIPRVESRLFAIALAGLIVRYEHHGREYIELPNWRKHQRVDKPTESEYPSALSDDSEIIREASRGLAPDRIGEDQGKDQEGSGVCVPEPPGTSDTNTSHLEVVQ